MKLQKAVSLTALILGAYQVGAQTLQVKETVNLSGRAINSVHAGEAISVRYNASGLYGKTANLWLVNDIDLSEEALAFNVPVVKGWNHWDIPIGFSWWLVGPWHVEADVPFYNAAGDLTKQITSKGTSSIRILSSVLSPHSGAVLDHNQMQAFTWVKCSINAEFLRVWLFNVHTGYISELPVADNINPTTGFAVWTPPANVPAGPGYQLLVGGFVTVTEGGESWDDEMEYNSGPVFSFFK